MPDVRRGSRGGHPRLVRASGGPDADVASGPRGTGVAAIAAQPAAAGAPRAAADPERAAALRRHSAAEAPRPRPGGLDEGPPTIPARHGGQAPSALVLLQSPQLRREPERGVGLRGLARVPVGMAPGYLQARRGRLHLPAALR